MATYTPSETFFGVAIIAFIDLLGFSAAVRRHWGRDDNSPLSKLLRIKARALEPSTMPSAWVKRDRDDGDDLDFYGIRVKTVSDSIVLCINVPDGRNRHDHLSHYFSCLFELLQQLTECCQATIDEGFVVRGAIEIGDLYWSTTETIGPALIDAYRLEATVANSARVILGPKLATTMCQFDDSFLKELHGVLITCDDGVIAVDGAFTLRSSERGGNLYRVEKLKNEAGSERQREKYHFLIESLTRSRKIAPTRDDYIKSSRILERSLEIPS
jgi:hypothetical protein